MRRMQRMLELLQLNQPIKRFMVAASMKELPLIHLPLKHPVVQMTTKQEKIVAKMENAQRKAMSQLIAVKMANALKRVTQELIVAKNRNDNL